MPVELTDDPYTHDGGGCWRKLKAERAYPLKDYEKLARAWSKEDKAKTLTLKLPCFPQQPGRVGQRLKGGAIVVCSLVHKDTDTYAISLDDGDKVHIICTQDATVNDRLIRAIHLLTNCGYLSRLSMGCGAKKKSGGELDFYLELEFFGMGIFGLVADLTQEGQEPLETQITGGATLQQLASAVTQPCESGSSNQLRRMQFSLDDHMRELVNPKLKEQYTPEQLRDVQTVAKVYGDLSTYFNEVEAKAGKERKQRITLADHQKAAVLAMLELEQNDLFRGGILAEEMGLGKTATIFALICYRGGLPEHQKAKEEEDARDRSTQKRKKDVLGKRKPQAREAEVTAPPPRQAAASTLLLRPHDDWNPDEFYSKFVHWDKDATKERVDHSGPGQKKVWLGSRSPFPVSYLLPGTGVSFIAPQTTLYITSNHLVNQVVAEAKRWTKWTDKQIMLLKLSWLKADTEEQHKQKLATIASQRLVVISFNDATASMRQRGYPWGSEWKHQLEVGDEIVFEKKKGQFVGKIQDVLRDGESITYQVLYDDMNRANKRFKRNISPEAVVSKKNARVRVDGLLPIRFERCVIDELQDSKQADFRLNLACVIAAKYRWCVSGTPFARDDDVHGTLKFLRHPLAEPLSLAYKGIGLLRQSKDAIKDKRGKLLYHVALPLLHPITLRQFPRAAISQEKLETLDLEIAVKAPKVPLWNLVPRVVRDLTLGQDDYYSGTLLAVHRNEQILAYDAAMREHCYIADFKAQAHGEDDKHKGGGGMDNEDSSTDGDGLKKQCGSLTKIHKIMTCSLKVADDYFYYSHKHVILRDVLKSIVEKSEKAVVFTWGADNRQSILKFLEWQQIPASKLNVSGKLVHKNTSWDVLVLNLMNKVTGLNLQMANHVIFTAPYLESWRVDQAIGRVLRMGQTRVYIWLIVGDNPLEKNALLRLLEELQDDNQITHSKRFQTRDGRGDESAGCESDAALDGTSQGTSSGDETGQSSDEDELSSNSERRKGIPSSISKLLLYSAASHYRSVKRQVVHQLEEGACFSNLHQLDEDLCREDKYLTIRKTSWPDRRPGECDISGQLTGSLDIRCGAVPDPQDKGKDIYFHQDYQGEGGAFLPLPPGEAAKIKEARLAAHRARKGCGFVEHRHLMRLKGKGKVNIPHRKIAFNRGLVEGEEEEEEECPDELAAIMHTMDRRAPKMRDATAGHDNLCEKYIKRFVLNDHWEHRALQQKALPDRMPVVLKLIQEEQGIPFKWIYIGATHDLKERSKQNNDNVRSYHTMFALFSFRGAFAFDGIRMSEQDLRHWLISEYEGKEVRVINRAEQGADDTTEDQGQVAIKNKAQGGEGLTQGKDEYFLYIKVRFQKPKQDK